MSQGQDGQYGFPAVRSFENDLCSSVHLFIRALGGQNGDDQKLKGISVSQLVLDILIGSP